MVCRHPSVESGRAPGAATAVGLAALLLAACAQPPAAPNHPAPHARTAAAAAGLLVVRVTGEDYTWHVRYPGDDGLLDTDDDVFGRRDLHIPAGMPTVVELTSNDYLYTLKLPQFELAEIAVPDLEFSMKFTIEATGTYELRGDQFCGYKHDGLIGKLVVLSAPDFEEWLRRTSDRADSPGKRGSKT